MFSDDFGDEMPRVAIMVDANDKKFECLGEKINGNIYLTQGWVALAYGSLHRLWSFFLLCIIGFSNSRIRQYLCRL
jgi:hypothetical protein